MKMKNNGGLDFEELANAHKDAVYRKMVPVCGNHATLRSLRSPLNGSPA